jgi:vacuolar-type H+-ATPase subunit F/Vma7
MMVLNDEAGIIALMQEQMGMLKSTLEEPIMSEAVAPPPLLIGSPITTSDNERERKELEQIIKQIN